MEQALLIDSALKAIFFDKDMRASFQDPQFLILPAVQDSLLY
jgi:hypothetical protein